MPGTYVLVISVDRGVDVDVGALGSTSFEAGAYAYVGSAFGPGGFSRVERHRELAAGERETRHWHVDYLLGSPGAAIERVLLFSEEDRECELARVLPGDAVPDFGASDCDCPSHLRSGDLEAIVEAGVGAGGVVN